MSLGRVTLIAGGPDQRDQAGRLIALLLDGLKYGGQVTPAGYVPPGQP